MPSLCYQVAALVYSVLLQPFLFVFLEIKCTKESFRWNLIPLPNEARQMEEISGYSSIHLGVLLKGTLKFQI